MEYIVKHLPQLGRFEVEYCGVVAYLQYEIRDNIIVIRHTIVPSKIGGKGIAAKLVESAKEYAKDSGKQIESKCSYAFSYLERNR